MNLSVSPASAETVARRPYPAWSSIFLAALPLLILAPAAFGFGPYGHPGISRWAFDLLQIKDSDGKQISRFPYDYDTFFHDLDDASLIPDAQPLNCPSSMAGGTGLVAEAKRKLCELYSLPNSAEHYYDPLNSKYLCSGTIEWQGITLFEGLDGSGYNGLSGFLFYLAGGSLDDDGNPTEDTSREGSLKFLRDFASSEDLAAAEKNFTMLLGCAFHYLEDIHSPGHTDWSSWWYIEGHDTCPVSYDSPPYLPGNWHMKCDGLGDAFFKPIEEVTNFDGCLEEFKPYHHDFQLRRDNKETLPLPITAYQYDGWPVYNWRVKKNEPVELNSDLAQLFHGAAEESGKTWNHFGRLEAYKPPDDTFSVLCTSFQASLESAAQECAGVVDWVFTVAANQDEIAGRDAPNFLGIAHAMAAKDTVNIPVVGLILSGALAGADQDDFYPLNIPEGTWSFAFQTASEAGLTMALYKEQGDTIMEGSSLQCVGPLRPYLRVFSTPQSPDRLLDCEYTIVISTPGSEPVPADLLERNLIANGNAEQGEGSYVGNTVDVPCWTTMSNFTVLRYEPISLLFPGTDCPGPEDRGLNLFFGGLVTKWSTASQSVDVSALQSVIDQRSISYTLSGYLGGYKDQDDSAVLTVWFIDSLAQALDVGVIGPVPAKDRNYVTGLLEQATEGRVPPGTRRLDIQLAMSRGKGLLNLNDDGYADNLELYLHVSNPGSTP